MRSKPSQNPWPNKPRPSTWRNDHRRVAQEMFHFASIRLGMSLFVWTLIGIALALPASLLLAQSNLSRLTADWGGRPGISVYFGLGALDGPMLAKRLEQQPGVESVVMTSQDEALWEFIAHSGLQDALAGLDKNPLPASLRLTFAEDADLSELDDLAASLRQETGVAEVALERTWLERISAAAQLAWSLGMVVGVLFGLGALLVTATSVRLAIETQLDELKVMKLVGANNAQIRRPFLYFGAFYGAGGGLFAAVLISTGLLILEEPLRALLGSFDQSLVLGGFGLEFLLALLGTGAVLGVSGAVLAVHQRLSRLDVL